MLQRLVLRDFVIVESLEIDFGRGFSVLTGETGAGKSILIDALQLVLGGRGDAGLVREGCARAEISAEFDHLPPSLVQHLEEAGFDPAEPLLLRRSVDAQGKSRAWIAGSPATLAQLKELGEDLVDIHGQHAWQSLTRPAAVRALLDAFAGIDNTGLTQAWSAWKDARTQLDNARARATSLEQERERLAWQISELDKLAPVEHAWETLNADHQRLAHAQSILDGVHQALNVLSEAESDNASRWVEQALHALSPLVTHEPQLAEAVTVLQEAQAQLVDVVRTLHSVQRHTDLDPEHLGELDARMATWMSLARRYRRQPQDLPATLIAWRTELTTLDAATDVDALVAATQHAEAAFRQAAEHVSKARQEHAPRLAHSVTQIMQSLGMAGGRFEIALEPLPEPQSHGLENVEFQVAGHAGTTPRAINKVASGGELSRIALALAVTTRQDRWVDTLIFDEVDAGIGGTVAETVGRLMQRLGQTHQVLAITHLAQVAACAHQHLIVSKNSAGGRSRSQISTADPQARVEELSRMLGGHPHSEVGLAHARAMLATLTPYAPQALE
ncbi:DNA repair protein RecN [Leptothrix ochracea]|uniref:DNA repair protein RecN n=1 Tax=Leptothrix ochracea TaxID=735331 RepID=UPI0034E22A5C